MVCPWLYLGVATLVLVAPAPAAAQGEARWFPGIQPFKTLIAAPREVQVRASFVHAKRPGGGFVGRNIEAEVAVGHRLSLVRLDDGSSPVRAITLGLEMGIFSRFFMEAPTKDLVNNDFRIGPPPVHPEWRLGVQAHAPACQFTSRGRLPRAIP